jgi:hypothetical protein
MVNREPGRQISIQSVPKDPPDVRGIALAAFALAMDQAAEEAEARAQVAAAKKAGKTNEPQAGDIT